MTARTAAEHATGVVVFGQQLSSVALILALLTGNVAVCAGWAATPEARMACCSVGSACPMHGEASPMHGEGSHHSHGANPVTQAQADSCCAASERGHSNQSSPTPLVVISSAVLGAGVVVPVTAPAHVTSDAWRTVSPIPIAPVAKHILLSVFLV